MSRRITYLLIACLVLNLCLLMPARSAGQGKGQIKAYTALDAGTPFLWLKASSIAQADGSAVATWSDLSGNGRNFTQGTAANRPTLTYAQAGGKAVVRFDGSNDVLASTFTLPQPYTLFAVVSPVVAGAAGVRLIDDKDITDKLTVNYNFPSGGKVSVIGGGTYQDSGYGLPPGKFSVIQVVMNGASSSVRLSGQNAVSISPGTATVPGLVLGAAANGLLAANYDLAELIIYASVLASDKATALRSALEMEYRVYQKRLVVFEGDSLTQGGNCSGSPYPTQTAVLLGDGWDWTNVGQSGQNIDQMQTDISSTVLRLKSGHRAKNIAVFWGGTNNLVAGESAASVTTKAQTWITAALNAGYQVVHVTTLPRTAVGVPVGFEAARQTYNADMITWCAGQGVAVADAGGNATIGQPGDSDNTTYYCDKVHLNGTGFAIVAGLVCTTINSLP